MENEMVFTDNEGKEIRCEIVANFVIDNISYVAYTDGTMVSDGEELYVSRCQKDENGEYSLEEIVDESEWKKVDDYLDKHLYDEEGFNV